MSAYLRRLAEAHDVLEPARQRLVLLTGQSSFASSALSPRQCSFLEAVAPPGCEILEMGFPYAASFHGAGFRETGLLAASWRNARQVCWSQYSPEFAGIAAVRLQALLDSTARRLILITASCGLQIANAAWPMIRVPDRTRVDIVALGPACFGALRLPVTVVRGSRDIWSRAFYRGPVDFAPPCGHLGYWECEDVRRIVADFSTMKRIVFVAPPFAGHLNPLLALAQAAQDAGYDVSIVTGERKLSVVRGLGLRASGLRAIGADSLEAIANSPSKVGSNPLRVLGQLRENLALLPLIRDELLARWTQEKPDLVVADSVAPVGGLVCDALGIPWITTIATPFAIENRRGVPAYCGGWRPGGWPGRDALGRLAIHSFKQAVAWRFRRQFALLGDGFPYRADGSERVYSPLAILGFGIAELEFERDWPPGFRMIGPVIGCSDPGPELRFAPGGRRVLVSVGTHLLWAKRNLAEDVARLAKEFPDVQFTVSMGGAAEPPALRSNNVAIQAFVPYERDLQAFDAVIHHGGAGVTYAAILHGIPSVVVPHDYDQFDYAARVAHFDLGLRAKTIAGAGPALRRVLARPEWPALLRMRAAARRYTPKERFLEAVREVFNPSAAPALPKVGPE